MQIPLLHQQIILQSERLRDLHRSIMLHTAPVPAAEMETILLEIRKLYSIALQLNHENALALLEEVHLAALKSDIPEIKSSIQPANLTEKTNAETPSVVFKEEAVKFDNTEVVLKRSEIKSEEVLQEKRPVSSDSHHQYHESPTFGNQYADHITLADKIAGKEGVKRVSDKLKSPVKDLKAAIGLNEKFQFINQLFNGDAQKYNSFIDELNANSDSGLAMQTISKISDANNWEAHASSAKLFMDIIERRFSA